jgi:hypothetical protein
LHLSRIQGPNAVGPYPDLLVLFAASPHSQNESVAES